MTISTTTVEASLQTALDATTGTTEAKELLLLGKAAEAITTVGGSLTSILTTQGDVLYRNATGPVRLAAGAAGEVLKSGGAGANPTWGAASGAADFELASNMTARQVAQIDATGKITPVSSTSPIAATSMTTTSVDIYPNTGGVTATGTLYHCAVDPSNTNRFAIMAGNGTPQISVGLVAADGSVTWGAKQTYGNATSSNGSLVCQWDPVNDGVLWARSGYSGSSINRFSVDVGGVTMTHLGGFAISSGYNWGDMSLHPTISGRFIMTDRSAGNLKLCDLTSATTFTVATTTALGSATGQSDYCEFFPDDGTKLLIAYGRTGGLFVRVAKLAGDAITLGTDVQMGVGSHSTFRGKSFSWEPNGDSSTGYRFAIMAQGMVTGVTDLIVGTVTNGGDGAVTVGTPIGIGSATTIGGIASVNLNDMDDTSNTCFSPYNKTDLAFCNAALHTVCTLVGNEITLGSTAVSSVISGDIASKNGTYSVMANLGSTGRYVSLKELTGGAIVNQHYKAAVSNLDADKVMGFVTAAGSTGDTRTVQYSGQIGGFSGLTIGAKHYAQEDASVTSTKVSTSVPVGVAVNATTLQVKL
jgi:hypothetical protein